MFHVKHPPPIENPRQGITVYEPNRQLHLGWRVWPEMIGELVRARELLWRLAWRDVRARTKQSVFGIAVNVFSPLALMGVFVFLNRGGVMQVGEITVPYPLFLYAGLLPWQMLVGSLTRATPSLVEAANLVGKIQFPRETLILSGVAQALFDYVLSLPLLVVLLLLFGQGVAWTVVFVPILLLLQLALVSGLGFFLALSHAAVRDVGNALSIVLVVWMFLTPIIYADPAEIGATPTPDQVGTGAAQPPVPKTSSALLVGRWVLNPMHALVVSYRDLMFRGRLTLPGSLAWSGLVCLAVWLFGWRVFHLVEPKIAERV